MLGGQAGFSRKQLHPQQRRPNWANFSSPLKEYTLFDAELVNISFIIFLWPTGTKPEGTKSLRKRNNGLQPAS